MASRGQDYSPICGESIRERVAWTCRASSPRHVRRHQAALTAVEIVLGLSVVCCRETHVERPNHSIATANTSSRIAGIRRAASPRYGTIKPADPAPVANAITNAEFFFAELLLSA